MKKICFALAAMASSHALAQQQPSSSLMYGVLDMALVAERGGASGPINKLTSGGAYGSRIGWRGTEALGDQLQAVFTLEAGVQSDTGRSDQAGQLFGRQAFVGLDSRYGMLSAGRQYNLQNQAISDVADPFEAGMAGSATNLMGYTSARIDHTVRYTSPEMHGLTLIAMLGLAEQEGRRSLGLSAGYVRGPLTLRLARQSLAARTDGAANANNTILAGNYNFRVLSAYASYGRNTGAGSSPFLNPDNPYGAALAPASSSDSRDLLLGVAVPWGRTTVLLSFIGKDDRDPANRDAQQLALGAVYSLSKRSTLYAAYAQIRNHNGAPYTVGNSTEAGSGNRALNLGLRHTF